MIDASAAVVRLAARRLAGRVWSERRSLFNAFLS